MKAFLVLAASSATLLSVAHAQSPSINIDGRIGVDAGVVSSGDNTANEAEIRYLWLGSKGEITTNWSYRVLLGFEGNKTSVKDGYIAYSGIANTKIMAGNFKTFNGIENMSGNLHTVFLERSMAIKPFRPLRRMGVGVINSGEHYSAQAGVFGGDMNNVNGDDEPWSYSGRFVFAPIVQKDGRNLLHLGISAYQEMPAADDPTLKFSAAGESHVLGTKLISTGTITDVDNYSTTAAEARFARGPFSLMSEFSETEVAREAGEDLSFSGGYVSASFFLTGEQRPYKMSNGTYGRVSPNNPVAEGGSGAIEFATRFSSLDLQEPGTTGGHLESVTFGVNWYPHKQVKLMLNHVLNDASRTGNELEDNQYTMGRVLVDF